MAADDLVRHALVSLHQGLPQPASAKMAAGGGVLAAKGPYEDLGRWDRKRFCTRSSSRGFWPLSSWSTRALTR